MIGQEISHYRVLNRLGAGGMGVVYEAEDLRLGRRVAIKMLPEMEKRPEALERFRREARSASALNHPNICTIYEIEEHEGQQFIVMELLQGQTLAHKIGNRPLKTELVLEYGIQIADALDAAHKKGIVHRDIKSGNLFINERGQIKVLDFGLAKLEEQTAPIGASATTASAPKDLTGRGTTLGTLLYMSPEQARGEELDARSDIFSFGTVLYEMATGGLPFRGGTPAVVFNEILSKNPPPPSRLNPDLPLKLDEVILKALEKDKDLRYQSASEMRADLRRLKRDSESSQSAAAAPEVTRRVGKNRNPAIAYGAMGVAVAVVVALLVWRPWSPGSGPTPASDWVQLTNFADAVNQPALSPDGHLLAFVRGPDTFVGPGQIYVKLLPNGEPKQLTHDSLLKMGPAFTPDGSQITYTALDPNFAWNTFTVPVLGGEPQLLLKNAAGLTWIGEHRLLFSEIKTGINMAIVTADESRSGERDVYVPPTARGMAHRSALSPNGNQVLLAAMDNNGWIQCRVVPFSGTSRGREVGPSANCTNVAWSPDGKWMYFSANAGNGFHLWRQRYPSGKPEQITFGPTEQEGSAMDATGEFLVTSAGTDESTLWMHNASGDRQISSEGFAANPQFSPDGKQLYFMALSYTVEVQGFISGELNVADLESGQITHVLPGLQISGYSLSPDGKQVAFAAYDRDHHPHVWLAPVDRSAPPRQLFDEEGDSPVFAPGGIIYYRSHTQSQNLIYRYKADGTREKLNTPPVHEISGISPDGRWIATWAWDGSNPANSGYFAVNTQDGHQVQICGLCDFRWGADGHTFILFSDVFRTGMERSYFISLPPGQDLPPLPAHGLRTPAEIAALKPKFIDAPAVPTPGGKGYIELRTAHHRNLYRIPLQ